MTIREVIQTVLGLGTRVEALEKKNAIETAPEGGAPLADAPETVEGAELSISTLTSRLEAIETAQAAAATDFDARVEAAVLEKTTTLEADFNTKVEAKAAELQADALAALANAPLKTGAATEDDKASLKGLKGRAAVTAAIAAERAS